MKKSATDVMHDIVVAAVLDAIAALKAASKGLPNTLLRDLNAIHANTTLADLPPELQAAIQASVRAAFSKLLKEGYSVAPGTAAQPARPPRPGGAQQPRHDSRRPGGGDRPRGPRPPRRDGPEGGGGKEGGPGRGGGGGRGGPGRPGGGSGGPRRPR
jgi:hypothetical protein